MLIAKIGSENENNSLFGSERLINFKESNDHFFLILKEHKSINTIIRKEVRIICLNTFGYRYSQNS